MFHMYSISWEKIVHLDTNIDIWILTFQNLKIQSITVELLKESLSLPPHHFQIFLTKVLVNIPIFS